MRTVPVLFRHWEKQGETEGDLECQNRASSRWRNFLRDNAIAGNSVRPYLTVVMSLLFSSLSTGKARSLKRIDRFTAVRREELPSHSSLLLRDAVTGMKL